MKASIQDELEEKKVAIAKRQAILEIHCPDEIDKIRSSLNKYHNPLEREQYYGEKLDFLSSIAQRAEELSIDSPTEKQEKSTLTPETIQEDTMDITESEINFVISQIRSTQIDRNREEEGR